MSKLDEDLARAFARFVPTVNEQTVRERMELRKVQRVARRRIEVGALAIVVVVSSIATAAGLRVAFRSAPTPAERPIRAATRFVLPARPLAGIPAGGSLWTVVTGAVLQVDITTGTVVRRIQVDRPGAIISAAGSVWVLGEGQGAVLRIDPRSGAVLSTTQLQGATRPSRTPSLTGDQQAVWVSWSNTLSEIDPATNTVTRSLTVPSPALAIAIEGNDIWVAEGALGMWRVDPVTGEIDRHVVMLSRGRQVIVQSIIAGSHSVIGVGENVRLYPTPVGPIYDFVAGSTLVRLDVRTGAQHTHHVIGLSTVSGPGGVFVMGPDRTLARIDPETGQTSRPIRISEGLAFAVSGSTVWVSQGGTKVVYAVDSSTAPAAPAVRPSRHVPGNDLGPLGCPASDQTARDTSQPLAPPVTGETSPDAIRRTFHGILVGDVVTEYRAGEEGQYVKVVRNGAVVARMLVTGGGGGWVIGEITRCAGTGIHPPH